MRQHSCAIKAAPASGEVVNRGCCGGRDLGPLQNREEPHPDDIERFSGVTRTCTACRKEVYDDAEVCYHCGEALDASVDGTKPVPKWVVVTAIVAMTALMVVVIFR